MSADARPGAPRWVRAGLLALLLVGAAAAGLRAWRHVREFHRTETVCAAVAHHDWQAALENTADLVRPTVAGLRAANCRCTALMETGNRQECVDSLTHLLQQPETGDWLPIPSLVNVLIDARTQEGDLPGAAALAHRGALAYPQEPALLYFELELRRRLEPEPRVLADLRSRLPQAGAAAPRLRLWLAQRYVETEDWRSALEVLDLPDAPQQLARTWYELQAFAFAGAGEPRQLLAACDRLAHVTSAAHARATYAYFLSVQNLPDPLQRDPLELLHRVVDDPDTLDSSLQKLVYMRWVWGLALEGHRKEALAAYHEGVAQFGDLYDLDPNDLARTAETPAAPSARGTADVRFTLDHPRPGEEIRLSPAVDRPVDDDFTRHPVPASGRIEVSVKPEIEPLRWVLRGPGDTVEGSGTLWPSAEAPATVAIQRRPPVAVRDATWTPPPPDGVRRLFLVILDCGDWRFVQYGRARGDLPILDRLMRGGYRAVVDSEPPFTAIAINRIAYPSHAGVGGVFGVLHQLGGEIQGLNFIGENPVDGLRWVVPQQGGLFATLGATRLKTVNMLHSHGALQVGRHGEVIGPWSAVGTLSGMASTRPLDAEERRIVRSIEPSPESLIEEMAADFDTVLHLARDRSVDFVALRVASLDLMTHGTFPLAVKSGQDDGDYALLNVYRYIDGRLGQIAAALDGDDVLVVMSDHGIRTALQHDPRALFVAYGNGIAPGRAPGQPPLPGIGRMVADYFGVATDWPSSELEAWIPGATGHPVWPATTGEPAPPLAPPAAAASHHAAAGVAGTAAPR